MKTKNKAITKVLSKS